MLKPLAILLLSFALLACAAGEKGSFHEAAMAPLGDLNLIQAEIPAVLLDAQNDPYYIPEEATCESLARELDELDAVLGPDLDTGPAESDQSVLERGEEAAKAAMVGAVRRTTESLVPFRSWVRKLSGAERNSQEVSAAIAAGTARRAFLKGVMMTRECLSGPAEM